MKRFFRTHILASVLLVAVLAFVVGAACKGDVGTQGPQGSKGDKGDTGAAGPQGAAGAQGPAGARGADGAQGPAGLRGPQGDVGPRGPAGATGPQGAPAKNPQAALQLEKTTVASGSTAAKSVSFTVMGSGFKPKETVLIEIPLATGSDFPGAATANDNGSFKQAVKTVKLLTPGVYTVLAQGSDGSLTSTILEVVAEIK